MIDLKETSAGERSPERYMNESLDNLTIVSVRAYSRKSYGLDITSKGLRNPSQLTISISAYYLLKLLKSFGEQQLPHVEECISKIEKSSFTEGELHIFPVPVTLKPEISIKITRGLDSKLKSNIHSVSNIFHAKGVSKKYVSVNKQQRSDSSTEGVDKRILNLLAKSYELYSEYKKEGFGEFFSRKICGLENDILFELAKLYSKESADIDDE